MDTVSYPSSSPNVISIGGTKLGITSSVPYTSSGEVDWYDPDGDGFGHGLSSMFLRPSYQTQNTSIYKEIPDVSIIGATPSGNGVTVYNSLNGGYLGVYGTSLSSPVLAGLIATANSNRTANLTRAQIMNVMYASPPISFKISQRFINADFVPLLMAS